MAVTSSRILVIQKYIPLYRVAFFCGLRESLSTAGIDLQICALQATGAQAERGDAGDLGSVVSPPRRPRRLNTGVAAFEYFGSTPLFSQFDGLVLPAAASLLDAHVALRRPRRHRQPVALWGHIAPYVKAPNRLDAAIERAMMRSADRVLAYTARGRTFAIDAGVSPDRAVCLGNTIDTAALARAIRDLAPEEIDNFARSHDLQGRRVYAYIGGLDQSKRIDKLAEILEELRHEDPSARVLVAGRGEQGHLLAAAADSGQAIMLGYADDSLKAMIGAVASALINPGRIGLLAVDALTLGLPIVTMPFRFHAPEVDYLEEGVSLFTAPDSTTGFVETLHRVHRYPPQGAPQLAEMVASFSRALVEMMAAP